jgi:hypothetical protein
MTNEKNSWPDFLIIGTARSGTTALHEHLGKHPGIFMPLQKEPCFFTFYNEQPVFKEGRHKYLTSKDAYLQLSAEKGDRIWGESSTPYMYFPEKSIENIQKLLPQPRNVQIIIILRNPADRAFSQFMHNRRDLREPLTFEEAIAQEKQRMEEGWHFDFFYVDKGYYFHQVQSYLENFKDVHIIMYDDLEKDPTGVVNGVFDFLHVAALPELGEVKKRNQSGEMKIKWFKRLMSNRKNPILNGIRKLMSKSTRKRVRNFMKNLLLRHNLKQVDMAPETRQKLIEMYRTDINELSNLIDKDLSGWLK